MKPKTPKIRVFALPSHSAVERVSGVDFVRVIQPINHLNKKEFEVQLYDPKLNEKMDWLTVIPANDILFLNYTTNPWSFAIMGAIARKQKRKIVLDMDDALWEVLPDNTAYETFKKDDVLKTVTSICNEVDYITCTNSYLKNIIANRTYKRHEQIIVLPNYIDFNLYNHRCQFRDSYNIRILHFGSSSHFKSLQEEEFAKGLDRIMREYPNVIFKTVGALIPKYKQRWGMRYEQGFGDTDLYVWVKEKFPGFMDETDIIVAPLSDNIYNRAKSSIKFLEASSAIKPGVYQKIRQYEEVVKHGENGFLANRAEDWYESLKFLIDNKIARQKIAKKAFETVERDWQIQNNVNKYEEFFKKLRT